MVSNVFKRRDLCGKNKVKRYKLYKKLQPMPATDRLWRSIIFNHIIKLPISINPVTKTGYNNIFVIVDRFTKFSYFILTNENTDIKQLTYIVLKVIINIYNLFNKIISDKKVIFAFKF